MLVISCRAARGIARLLTLITLAAAAILAAPPARIQGPIQASRMVSLRGQIHRLALPENDRGIVPDSLVLENLSLMLKPSDEQAALLEDFLEQQRNPASPEYQHWLTPEEFGERFGASPADLAALSSWLQAQGFADITVARGRNRISVRGTAGQVARTFRTSLHRYAADGGTHFANMTEPAVPEAVADLVESIRGLDDFRPHPQRTTRMRPAFTASNGAHYLAPDDLAAIYNISALYRAGYDGTGQKIVIPGQTNINLADIRAFRSRFGLPVKDPQIVLSGSDPGVSPEDQIEADLDLEWSGAVARNATIIYVNSRNVFDSIQYAIDQNLAPVISLSYGGCETGNPAGFRSIAQQANAQGITWLNSSGDSGAAGCDYNVKVATGGPAVVFPANIPEVTAVGGTEFNETANDTSSLGWGSTNTANWASASGWISEKAWNDTALGQGLASTGGGASQVYGKPWWQSGTGVPDDKARDVPDVSLSASGAHDGYLMFANGQLYSVGGTSASSPAFAGIVSLLNQYLVAKGSLAKAGLGNINPALYNLAQKTSDVFHDTIAGDNIVPCAAGSNGCANGSFGYKAGVGYDMVTGLGSVDAYNLVTKWTSQPGGAGTTLSLTASPASIASAASTLLTATLTAVTGASLPAGTVTFGSGNTALGSAPVVITGSKAAATFTLKGSDLAAGSNTILAAYVATGNFSNSTGTAVVSVTSTVVATTTTLVVNATSAGFQLTATVKPAASGTVTFAAGSSILGTALLASSAATLTITASKLAAGPNQLTASFAGASGFAESRSAPVTVVGAVPPIATAATVTAAPAAILPAGSTTIAARVKAATGSASPTGNVSFFSGRNALGSAPLSAAGVATLVVKGSALIAGTNTVTAGYEGNQTFASTSALVMVTVTPPAVATSTSVSATPASLPQTASTQVVATVKPGSGSMAPTGTVSFMLGTTQLGSVSLTFSASTATATLTVKGGALNTGENRITANYIAAGNFTSSSGQVTVTVLPGTTATAASLSASSAAVNSTGTAQLQFSVKATTGRASPTGSAKFTAAGIPLSTVALTSSGINAVGSVSIKGSSLPGGINTILATYIPTGNFGASAATAQLTVVADPALKSSVVFSAALATSVQAGIPAALKIQEQNGVPTKLTGLTINGTSFSSAISALFGNSQLPARGTLIALMSVQWFPQPATLTFVLTGTDAGGRVWTQTTSLKTGK